MTQIIAHIPKAADSSQSTYKYTITPIIRGKAAPVLYESPMITVGANTSTAPAANAKGYTITASYNPKVENGISDLTVTITSRLGGVSLTSR